MEGTSVAEDGDFELTAEMMIHDALDDETTLEDADEADSDELDNLQEEGEIPLEQLLARYGYGGQSGVERVDEEFSDSSSDSSPPPTGAVSSADNTRTLTGQTSSQPDLTGQTSSQPDLTDAIPSIDQTSDYSHTIPPTISIQGDDPSHVSSQLMPPMLEDPPDSIGGDSSGFEQGALLGHTHKERGPPPLLLTNDTLLPHETHVQGVYQSQDHLSDNVANTDRELQGDNCLRSDSDGGALLGKRSRDPVYNDVSLASKHPALLVDGDTIKKSTSHVTMATNSSHWVRSGRLRREPPDRRSAHLMMEGDRNVVDAYFSTLIDADSEDSDDEYVPREEWRQEIKVGPQYQAVVLDHSSALVPGLSYRTPPNGTLIWRPEESSGEIVSEYLEAISQSALQVQVHCDSERDNEQALEVLQNCGHDVNEALEEVQRNGLTNGRMEPWTESECQSFEEGLRLLGKDFYRIQKQVPSRTVKELIEFYYQWKKSERCDLFVQQYGKFGRRKIVVPAGHVSDFMNKYLDMYSEDSPDIHYAATTVYAEAKKEST